MNSIIRGIVKSGAGRGSEIGFPTANIEVNRIDLDGVYAVKVKVNKKTYNAIANVGYAPTVNRNKLLVEVHIFDFSGNMYDKEIEIKFVKFMRKEKKFNSIEELKNHIKIDCEKAKEILKNAPTGI